MAGTSRADSRLVQLCAHLETLNTRQLRVGIIDLVARGLVPDPSDLEHAFGVPPGSLGTDLPAGDGTPDPAVLLLSGIDNLLGRIESGEFERDEDQWPYRHDRDWWEDDDDDYYDDDPSWQVEFEALVRETDQFFAQGDLVTASIAYGRLLRQLADEDLWDYGISPWRVIEVDIERTKSRYLRAVYETTPATERSEMLLNAARALAGIDAGNPESASLTAIVKARRNKIRDLPEFLEGWIQALRSVEDPTFTSRRDDYLTEAAEMSGGVDSLGALARTDGARNPRFWLRWLQAMAETRSLDEVTAAASEASGHKLSGALQAEVHDLVGTVAARTDPEIALEHCKLAFRCGPSHSRLCLLVAAIQDTIQHSPELQTASPGRRQRRRSESPATTRDALSLKLAEQSDWIAGKRPEGLAGRDEALPLAALHVAAGRIDEAACLLDSERRSSWRFDDPRPLIIPLLLASCCPQWPPTETRCLLSKQVSTKVAALGDAPGAQLRLPGSQSTRVDAITAETTTAARRGATVLKQQITAVLAADAGGLDRSTLLTRMAAAMSSIDDEVDEVLSAKQREVYPRVAKLVVASAEVIAMSGSDDRARQRILDVRDRYPRHTAFKKAIEEATGSSPLFGSPGSSAAAKRRR